MTFDETQTAKKDPVRRLLKYILLIGLLVLLYASNPSRDDHQAAVKAKISALLSKSVSADASNQDSYGKAGTELGLMFGNAIISKMIEQVVDRKNYLFFSLTTFNYQGTDKIIGIGILGNVFISKDVESEYQKAVKGN